jgi:sulfur carrier protein ThiS
MKVTFHLLPTRKQTRVLDLKEGAKVEDAVRVLGLYPDAWVAVRGSEPIPSDGLLMDGDQIKLVSVISGG